MSSTRRRSARLQAVEEKKLKLEEVRDPEIPMKTEVKSRRLSSKFSETNEKLKRSVSETPDEGIASSPDTMAIQSQRPRKLTKNKMDNLDNVVETKKRKTKVSLPSEKSGTPVIVNESSADISNSGKETRSQRNRLPPRQPSKTTKQTKSASVKNKPNSSKLKLNNEKKSDQDDSIMFSNSSDEEAKPEEVIVSRTGRAVRQCAVKARRSLTVKAPDSDSMTSSSEDDSDQSDFEEEQIPFKNSDDEMDEHSSIENDDNEEVEEVEEVEKLRKTISRCSNRSSASSKSKRSNSSTNSSKKSASSKTGGSSRSSKSGSKARGGGGRTHMKKKIAQPWQKILPSDESGASRKMSKGERRMLEFRILSRNLATGKLTEMTIEEAADIIEELKSEATRIKNELILQKSDDTKDADENSSSSEDEWEEMEALDDVHPNLQVNVTVEKKKEEPNWWAFYLRQEVNKVIRENWENTHKAHLLCYIAHLQFVHKTVTFESFLPSLIITQMPIEYTSLIGEAGNVKNIKKIAAWYTSAYKPLQGSVTLDNSLKEELRYTQTVRYASLINEKSYETDLDRAALLFALFCGFETICRICVNLHPIDRSWNKETIEKYKSSNKKSSNVKATSLDYWVEVWETKLKRWICVNPVNGSVDEPNGIESMFLDSVSYVFAIDNKKGVRDVTPRYASDFVKPHFRRRRTDKPWVLQTLRKKSIMADPERAQLEDVYFKTELVMRPLPPALLEYKNHPLYVLEKDLLKFQAIYPPVSEQKPIGCVKGHNVYPRDTVYTLQGEKRWEKMARSIKKGEKPYKTVRALTDPRIPVEEREITYVGVYGFWQTEPFQRLKVKNGKIPRNEFGNVYIYQPSMCPIGATHLKLPGLPMIARKLNKECVPVVCGWDFHSCSNYPIIDGACVLDEDVDEFIEEWTKQDAYKRERESTKRQEKTLENWRKLIKGMLRLHYVKAKFGAVGTSGKTKNDEKKNMTNEAEQQSSIIDRTEQISTIEFSLDRLTKK